MASLRGQTRNFKATKLDFNHTISLVEPSEIHFDSFGRPLSCSLNSILLFVSDPYPFSQIWTADCCVPLWLDLRMALSI